MANLKTRINAALQGVGADDRGDSICSFAKAANPHTSRMPVFLTHHGNMDASLIMNYCADLNRAEEMAATMLLELMSTLMYSENDAFYDQYLGVLPRPRLAAANKIPSGVSTNPSDVDSNTISYSTGSTTLGGEFFSVIIGAAGKATTDKWWYMPWAFIHWEREAIAYWTTVAGGTQPQSQTISSVPSPRPRPRVREMSTSISGDFLYKLPITVGVNF